jgi:hypothetical protein
MEFHVPHAQHLNNPHNVMEATKANVIGMTQNNNVDTLQMFIEY